MNTMLAMVIIQLIYLKLCKKGPNTQMCFYTNSCHREQTRTPSLLLTHSLSTNNMIRTDYHHSLIISYTK